MSMLLTDVCADLAAPITVLQTGFTVAHLLFMQY